MDKQKTKDYMKLYLCTHSYSPAMGMFANRGGFIYATDGHRAIRVKESDGFDTDENPDYPNVESVWGQSMKLQTPLKVSFNKIKWALDEIPLTADRIECPECEGDGEVTCHCCGFDNECQECDGDGYTENPNKQVPDFENYKIDLQGVGVNPRFLSDVMKGMELENAEELSLLTHEKKKGNLWQFGKYELLIMPCDIEHEEKEYIIKIEL